MCVERLEVRAWTPDENWGTGRRKNGDQMRCQADGMCAAEGEAVLWQLMVLVSLCAENISKITQHLLLKTQHAHTL